MGPQCARTKRPGIERRAVTTSGTLVKPGCCRRLRALADGCRRLPEQRIAIPPSCQLADGLHASPETVETYRVRIKEKQKPETLSELIQRATHWVLQNG
jgi:FixJ family two-component response regulator